MNKLNFKKIVSVVLSIATLSIGTIAYADTSERLKGDVDGNGVVTSGDALAILRHSINVEYISEENHPFADIDGDGNITSNDALGALRIYFKETAPVINFPSAYTANCGDRFELTAEMTPKDLYSNVTFKYVVGKEKSEDGIEDSDGEPYNVIETTNLGKIKAFHPGTATVTAIASNGMKAVCTVTVTNLSTVKTISSGDNSLSIVSRMMTNSDCYNESVDMEKVEGIVVHSTAVPGVDAERWYTAWNKPGIDAGVHAFLDDNVVMNYLPMPQMAWHAGKPANKTYHDFEICEPSGFYYFGNNIDGYDVAQQQAYFDKIWANATLYTAYLCDLYGLSAENVISHNEVGLMGIGTHHGDPDHWFKLHNKDMDDFRADVEEILNRGISVSETTVLSDGYAPSGTSAQCNDVDCMTKAIVGNGEGWRY